MSIHWGEDDDEPWDGTLAEGTVTLTQHSHDLSWSAACAVCPWTATAGLMGQSILTYEARYHPCTAPTT